MPEESEWARAKAEELTDEFVCGSLLSLLLTGGKPVLDAVTGEDAEREVLDYLALLGIDKDAARPYVPELVRTVEAAREATEKIDRAGENADTGEAPMEEAAATGQDEKAVLPGSMDDWEQFLAFQDLLGDDAPQKYDDFQKLKQYNPDGWAELEEEARKEQVIRSAPCELTEKKFSGFFLRPGAKHADDFFNVGYTSDHIRQLRYDIASQYNLDKAIEWAKTGDGKSRFNIYMELGTHRKKYFCIGWVIDSPEEAPRIVTGFRRQPK